MPALCTISFTPGTSSTSLPSSGSPVSPLNATSAVVAPRLSFAPSPSCAIRLAPCRHVAVAPRSSAGLPVVSQLALWGGIEFCWNVYPPNIHTSLALVALHVVRAWFPQERQSSLSAQGTSPLSSRSFGVDIGKSRAFNHASIPISRASAPLPASSPSPRSRMPPPHFLHLLPDALQVLLGALAAAPQPPATEEAVQRTRAR